MGITLKELLLGKYIMMFSIYLMAGGCIYSAVNSLPFAAYFFAFGGVIFSVVAAWYDYKIKTIVVEK